MRIWAEPAAVAEALKVSVVELPMVAMVVPAGIPGPEMGIPTARPAVLATVTAVEARVVVAPPMNKPPAPSVRPEATVAVALVLRTKAVPLVTLETVAPAGMPAP